MASKRIIVALECEECGRRNYTTTKRRDNKAKLSLRKYCKWCRKHTVHKEKKV